MTAARPPVDPLFLEVQQALAGEYSLERELGRGGMGVVYLAQEVRLARQVALKVLPPEMAAVPETREQFVREAQMAARLSHPNIVPIHRVDEAGAFVYFAMTYVNGLTLGEHVRTRGPLVPDHAIRVLREVAWALTYAHTSGLVHRDVKPDNIMLEQDTGRVLVTDFGIALATATAAELEHDGRVVGTAHYMSPEQAMGEPVDARSDIYSLGVVAFHALTGQLPFNGTTSQEILAKHISEHPPSIRTAAPAVPLRLAQAVDTCLAKDPGQRFQRASDFAGAIEQSVEPVREIPAPLRVWITREEKTRPGRIIGTVYGVGGIVGLVGRLTGEPALAIPAALVFAAAVVVLPTLYNTRKVLRAGYTIDDLRNALDRHWARRREELAVEISESPAITARSAAIWAGASVALGAAAGMFAPGNDAIPAALATGGGALIFGGVLAIVRAIRRRRAQVRLPIAVRLWRSKWGERLAKLAGLRVRPTEQQRMLPQATEVALGRATDALYAALPKPLQKQLEHVPRTVRRLEQDATVMREQISKIESSIALLDGDARLHAAGAGSPEAQVLRADLHRIREQSNGRLATTVAAIENIRLGLIRLQLGSSPVESVTAVLDAARSVADDIDRAADAQQEVELLLRATQSHRPR